jgi:hypothetical protein
MPHFERDSAVFANDQCAIVLQPEAVSYLVNHCANAAAASHVALSSEQACKPTWI